MASNKLLESNFNYGDCVVVKKNAPNYYKPGFSGCICGIRMLDTQDVVLQFNNEINSEIYLVEFNDGETLEIPKNYLEYMD